MGPDLTEVQEYIAGGGEVPIYQPFCGKPGEQLGKLRMQQRVPLGGAHILERRFASTKPDWKNYSFDTSDFVVYGGKRNFGDLKVFLTINNRKIVTPQGNKLLEAVSSRDFRNGEGVAHELYNEIDGIVISDKELRMYQTHRGGFRNGHVSEKDVLDDPLWRIVLRHPDAVPSEFAYDASFMEEVVGKTFAHLSSYFNPDNFSAMGISLLAPSEIPFFRTFAVSDSGGRCWLRCGSDFKNGYACFVGESVDPNSSRKVFPK